MGFRRYVMGVVAVCLVSVAFVCCKSKTGEKAVVTGKETARRIQWVDPRKGKFYGQINMVQIPLTAMENHIVGPVKSVRYRDYNIGEQQADKNGVLADSGYNVYDQMNNLVDQNEYDAKGVVKWHCIYRYDDKNKAIEWLLHMYDSKIDLRTTFKYDGRGNKTEEITEDTGKKYSGRVTYTYDDKGNELSESRYNVNDKPGWITAYTYDPKGYQVAMAMKDSNGQVMQHYTVAYDDSGDKIAQVSYKDTIKVGKSVCKIDAANRTEEITDYDRNDSVTSRSVTKYDDEHNYTEILYYAKDGSIDEKRSGYYQYEYDSWGNVTKMTEYEVKDGKKVLTGMRETEYTYY